MRFHKKDVLMCVDNADMHIQIHGIFLLAGKCTCDSVKWTGVLCKQCAPGYQGETCEAIPTSKPPPVVVTEKQTTTTTEQTEVDLSGIK